MNISLKINAINHLFLCLFAICLSSFTELSNSFLSCFSAGLFFLLLSFKKLIQKHSKNEGHGIWFHHFMAYRWGNNENNERLYFLGLPNHCRWWLQPWSKKTLAPWRKSMNNLDSILKNRDITLLTKVHLVKAIVFPVVTYGCESWTIKKAECWRIDAFELCYCEKTLESPLECKEIKPAYPERNQS